MNALIAGEVQFLQISGGTTASAALGGADVMVVGTTLDALVQNLMARPEIDRPEQLKGKSVGITRFGTSIDVGARLALRHFGLVPEKEVAIVQVGGMDSMVTGRHSFLSGDHPGAQARPAHVARYCLIGNSLRVHRNYDSRPLDQRGTRPGAPLHDGANRGDRPGQTR
jgi:ABC-type nitrate/sulfonate/bicarbonate transport system substrate-binding protein